MNHIELIDKSQKSQNNEEFSSLSTKNNLKVQQNRPSTLTVSKIYSSNQKWRQCKIIGKNITIRSYSASCAFKGNFYVYGGYQILGGSLGDFYYINLDDNEQKFNWVQIPPKNGVSPGPRSKHSMIAGKQKIYLIGGIFQGISSSNDIFQWDGQTQNWIKLVPQGIQNLPKLDSFGCVMIQKQGVQKIYIVGGYNGDKALMQNAVYEYIPSKNTISVIFKNYPTQSKDIMHVRCGHAIATDNQNIYIFGGKNQNQRFNDIWIFNLLTLNYQRLPDAGDIPSIRNGHSMTFYNHRLFVFGGIHDITWELDDLHIYNLVKKQWTTLEQDSPRRVEKKTSPDNKQQKSIQKKNNKKKNWYESIGGSLNPSNKSHYNTPSNPLIHTKTPNTVYQSKQKPQQQTHQGNMLDQQRRKVFYQKKQQMLKTFQVNQKQKERYIQFQTTSQAMRNSLDIIGNLNGKQYQNSQKLTEFGKQTHSKFLAPLENNSNLVIGKKPCARDGHCSVMLNGQLIIFGGDRHQMSFNDIYKLNFSLAQKQSQQ